MDDIVKTDMQKDRVVQTISSTWLDETKSNKSIFVDNIEKTVLFDENGKQIVVIEGGYLDIGLIDTMKDLFVNLLGAVLFSMIGYFYIKNKEKYKFAENFIPQKKDE
jgi:hypothetical protein